MGMCLNFYTEPNMQVIMYSKSLNCFVTAFDDAYAEFQRLK